MRSNDSARLRARVGGFGRISSAIAAHEIIGVLDATDVFRANHVPDPDVPDPDDVPPPLLTTSPAPDDVPPLLTARSAAGPQACSAPCGASPSNASASAPELRSAGTVSDWGLGGAELGSAGHVPAVQVRKPWLLDGR